jgi:hypothetical protein
MTAVLFGDGANDLLMACMTEKSPSRTSTAVAIKVRDSPPSAEGSSCSPASEGRLARSCTAARGAFASLLCIRAGRG